MKFLAEAEQNETLGQRRRFFSYFGLWTLAPRARASLFEYMQFVQYLKT